MRSVAFLRGINVGGHNKVPMATLRARLTDAGLRDVKTYIQSGNVVFSVGSDLGGHSCPRTLIQTALRGMIDADVPVVVRTADALAQLAAACPFPAAELDPRQLHLGLCTEAPDPERVRTMDPDFGRGDRYEVAGESVYLHTPGGMGKTRLTSAWFDRNLGVQTTFRNWRTLTKVLEMAKA